MKAKSFRLVHGILPGIDIPKNPNDFFVYITEEAKYEEKIFSRL
jgi:hypothetical protein